MTDSTSPVAVNADSVSCDGRVQIQLLDGFSVTRDGRPLAPPPSARRLLAYIGIRGSASRAEAAGILWPDVNEVHAHASLRTALWRLRQLDRHLLTRIDGQIAVQPEVSVDVTTLRALAHEILAGSRPHVTLDAVTLTGLLSVGELLPGWYDDWVLFERERLRQLHLHVLEFLARGLAADGRHAEAVDAALAAIRLEPLRESSTRILIEVFLAEGNIVEALRRYDIFSSALAGELGIRPSAALHELVESANRRLATASV